MRISSAKAKASAVSGKLASVVGYIFAPLFFLLFVAYLADDEVEVGTFCRGWLAASG